MQTQTRSRDVILARAEREYLHVWREIEAQALFIVQQWIRANAAPGVRDADLGRDWVAAKLRELFEQPRDWRRLFGRIAEQTDDDVLSVFVRTVPKVDRRILIKSQRVDEFAQRNAGLIRGMQGVVTERVGQFFQKVESSGLHVEAMTERLQTEFAVGEARARLWARDQTLKLHAEITEERHKAVGITEYVWTTSGDERVRKGHAELDGQTFSYDDPPVVDEKTGRRANPGEDYQCLPGDAQIAFARPVNRLFRRWYTGELTTLVTDTGETLDCTPNHPVLTTTGWQPAERVQIGDHVWRASEHGGQLLEANVKHGVPRIADVFEAFSLVFPFRRESGVATQFHNDGLVDQHVDVVDVDSALWVDVKTGNSEQRSELVFTPAFAARLGLREVQFMFEAVGAASYSGVGCLRDCLLRFFRGIGETRYVCPASSSELDPRALQESVNRCADDPVALRKLFDGHATCVFSQALVLREWFRLAVGSVNALPLGAGFTGENSSVLGVSAKLARDFTPGETLLAKPTRVVEVFRRVYSGHVYNLSTGLEWYVAQNLYTHNCRCTAFPVL